MKLRILLLGLTIIFSSFKQNDDCKIIILVWDFSIEGEEIEFNDLSKRLTRNFEEKLTGHSSNGVCVLDRANFGDSRLNKEKLDETHTKYVLSGKIDYHNVDNNIITVYLKIINLETAQVFDHYLITIHGNEPDSSLSKKVKDAVAHLLSRIIKPGEEKN